MDYFFLIILGLCWGSFLTAVAFRIDDLKSLFVGRSRCPKCKHRLGFFDLIPILSFVFLSGCCRYCKKKISIFYPLTELVTALILVAVYLYFGLSIPGLAIFLSLSLIVVASLNDIFEQEVNLWLFISGIILALIFRFWGNFNLETLINLSLSIAVCAVLPLLFALISREKWMGYGDIFFAIWVGSFVLFPQAALSVFAAFFLGALFGIIILAVQGRKKENRIPFGPFLTVGGLLGLFLSAAVASYLQVLGF